MTQHSLRGVPLEDRILQLRNRWFFLLDLVLIPLSAYLAFVLRLESLKLGRYLATACVFMITALISKILLLAILNGYSRYWPFAGLPEVMLILQSVVLGEILATGSALLVLSLLGESPPPRSIPILDFLLSVGAVAGPRLGIRWLYRFLCCQKVGTSPELEIRVLIVGAGEGGRLVLQEMQRNPQLGLHPLGFVDDDANKQRLRIQGVQVLGAVVDIPQLVKTYRVERVFIAVPSATSDEMRRIVEVCQEANVEVRTLPGVYELIQGDVQIQRFRPVKVEDLLAREPVETDTTQIQLFLRGKCVLVTGAGGSIGSELCRQIAGCGPAEMVLLGHGENSVFHIHNELKRRFPALSLHPVIADVRDAARIDRILACYRPQMIFHAAAHKHVPLMERNPAEAVTNNVGGTRNLLRAAEAHGCRNFVMISTDKAVNPTSVMGATKRVAEQLVMAAAHRTGACYVAVRFGNVLGSRGSVVPVFEEQIKHGGPVTVTDPEVRRYFMTIPEAVQLVLQAVALGHGGEIFVLDMGEPIRIVDLARDMIRLAGFEAGRDIPITFTGLRPGEKLFEELFLDDEHYQRTLHEKIFVSRNGVVPPERVVQQIEQLLVAADAGDVEAILANLQVLVPECHEAFGGRARAVVAGR
jgi:FlaA1/EpsC-like NDP-sugar epimerase